MNKQDVTELFEYNKWARDRLLSSLEIVNQEDFEKDLHSSHGGIRGTLYHMINAENIWYSRLAGRQFKPLDETSLCEVKAFRAKWNELDTELGAYIGVSTEEELSSSFNYQDSRGNSYSQPRVWAFGQLFNHFTYHRGQIVAMQRQLGYKAVNTDLIGFYRERGK